MAGFAAVVSQADAPNGADPSCDEVLEACDLYVTELQIERDELKLQIGELEKDNAELRSKAEPTPWWQYVLIGAAGAVIINEVR